MKNIEVGDTVFFVIEGDKVDFFKMGSEKMIREMAGSWKGKIKGSSIAAVKNIRAEWSKRGTC